MPSPVCDLVRAEGLEPPQLAPPEPKSGASTNSATPARGKARARACRHASGVYNKRNWFLHQKYAVLARFRQSPLKGVLNREIWIAMTGPRRNFPHRRMVLAGLAGAAAAPAALAQTPVPPALALRLSLRPGRMALRPGAPESEFLTVNDQFPAPVIRVKRGIPVEFAVENGLNQPTALHVHGLRGAYASEGMPGLGAAPILPGETRIIRIETPDAGTFIYTPVLAGRAGEQRERGLSGVLIVEELAPQPVDDDLVLALDDVRFDERGVIAGDFGNKLDLSRSGRLGNALIVNGKPIPEDIAVRPGARLRLRLASLANARIMPMKFENLRATVVALDGQACDPFDPLKRTVVLLPGSRYEVMLDAPAEPMQESRVLVALGTGLAVLRIRTEGTPLLPRAPVLPLPPNDVPPSIRLQNAVRAELTISGGLERPATPGTPPPPLTEVEKRFPRDARIWQLNNGLSNGFSGKPLFSVKRGMPVVLALVNRTAWGQVLTVHGHVFRLLHPLDDGWEPYFLDTLHLPENTVSRIAFDATNVGRWAIRSTIAEHYDAGIFTWFEVTA